MTNFEKITKTQKALAKFLSGLTIKHGCVNCPAHACGCSAKNCKQKWEEWLAEVEGKRISNFGWITLCPEELANFIAYRLGIEFECSACPVSPGDNDAVERWNTITDWLNKEVEK